MKENRYQTIDGLRGIAAMSVVIYHLTGNLETSLSLWVPQPIMTIFSFGYLGVPVFFVISGFVISSSISNNIITLKYFGNFVLRRSIRLDPPYWISIILALILIYSKNYYLGINDPIPTSASLFSHIFYLQEIIGFNPAISQVYWTLCLEIQFYLFFIITMAICQNIARKYRLGDYLYIQILCITVIGLYSLLLEHGLLNLEIKGLFFQNWHYFLMGIFLSLQARGIKFATQIIIMWLIIEILVLGVSGIKAYALSGILITLFIFIAAEKKLLSTIFTGYIIQYLGRISYSLYLLHADLGWKVISLGKLYFGENMSPLISLIVLATGIGISIIAAHLLYRYVEKPSVHFASKLRMKQDLL